MCECLKRICCATAMVRTTPDEEIQLAAVEDPAGRKCLVQRRTQLSLVILVQTLQLIGEIYTGLNNLRTIEAVYDRPAMRKAFVALFVGHMVCRFVVLLLSIAARVTWDRYPVSGKYLPVGYALKVFVPTVMFFIPFRDFIDPSDLVANFVTVSILAALSVIVLTPSILMIQTIISQANALVCLFPTVPGFRVVLYVIQSFYVPIFIIASGFLFQFGFVYNIVESGEYEPEYDMKIIGFVMTYIAFITIPNWVFGRPKCIPVRMKQMIAQVLFGIPSIVLAYFISSGFGVDLFAVFLNGFLESVSVSVAVKDALLTCVGQFAPSTELSFVAPVRPRGGSGGSAVEISKLDAALLDSLDARPAPPDSFDARPSTPMKNGIVVYSKPESSFGSPDSRGFVTISDTDSVTSTGPGAPEEAQTPSASTTADAATPSHSGL